MGQEREKEDQYQPSSYGGPIGDLDDNEIVPGDASTCKITGFERNKMVRVSGDCHDTIRVD
jgi:hypothetical protein